MRVEEWGACVPEPPWHGRKLEANRMQPVSDQSKQRVPSRLWPALAVAAAVWLLAAGCSGRGSETTGKGGGPGGRRGGGDGVPVTVAKVSQKDVPVEIQVVGN